MLATGEYLVFHILKRLKIDPEINKPAKSYTAN